MKKEYEITVRLKTPLHINSGVGRDGRRLFIKNDSQPYIPATLFKGILRNKTEMLIKGLDDNYQCIGKETAQKSCDCPMCRLFGKAGFQPSRIVVDNLMPQTETKTELRTNISINRYTKRTNDGALISSEAVSAAGTVFKGTITVYYTPQLLKYEKLILKSIEMIDSIGSWKSRGMGLIKTEVTAID